MNNFPERACVLYSDKTQAMPCLRGRAFELLKAGRAAIYKYFPWTIILKDRTEGNVQPVTIKHDPGSRTTGIAVVVNDRVVMAFNLEHRGHVVAKSIKQRSSVRGNRRNRKLRHRKPRFDNRRRPQGWIPPSIKSRVDNAVSWTDKLRRLLPITAIEIEQVRFDMQLMQNPETSGIEYQQGTLAGYELREYLLQKWSRKCAYCDRKETQLEIDHVISKAKGGSNRVSNLTIACHRCNQRKGELDVQEFVKNARRLKRILAQLKQPLKDAAAVNTTRFAIVAALKKSDHQSLAGPEDAPK